MTHVLKQIDSKYFYGLFGNGQRTRQPSNSGCGSSSQEEAPAWRKTAVSSPRASGLLATLCRGPAM